MIFSLALLFALSPLGDLAKSNDDPLPDEIIGTYISKLERAHYRSITLEERGYKLDFEGEISSGKADYEGSFMCPHTVSLIRNGGVHLVCLKRSLLGRFYIQDPYDPDVKYWKHD